MARDYDELREATDPSKDAAAALGTVTGPSQSPAVDAADDEVIDLAAADLGDASLQVRVVPPRSDEFICSECFLVHHVSQRASAGTCTDCD